jgi:hypothetical protein
MFDHVGVADSDLAASETFYRTVLAVLSVESASTRRSLRMPAFAWRMTAPTASRCPARIGTIAGLMFGSRHSFSYFG